MLKDGTLLNICIKESPFKLMKTILLTLLLTFTSYISIPSDTKKGLSKIKKILSILKGKFLSQTI